MFNSKMQQKFSSYNFTTDWFANSSHTGRLHSISAHQIMPFSLLMFLHMAIYLFKWFWQQQYLSMYIANHHYHLSRMYRIVKRFFRLIPV